MLTALCLAIFVAVASVVLLIVERRKTRRIREQNRNIRELSMVIRDLNRVGGGMLEIRRVEPGSVFLYSPE